MSITSDIASRVISSLEESKADVLMKEQSNVGFSQTMIYVRPFYDWVLDHETVRWGCCVELYFEPDKKMFTVTTHIFHKCPKFAWERLSSIDSYIAEDVKKTVHEQLIFSINFILTRIQMEETIQGKCLYAHTPELRHANRGLLAGRKFGF